MPAVLPPVVRHVELEPDIDGNRVRQSQHQTSFLEVEDGLAIAIDSAFAHGEGLDLAGLRATRARPLLSYRGSRTTAGRVAVGSK